MRKVVFKISIVKTVLITLGNPVENYNEERFSICEDTLLASADLNISKQTTRVNQS